MKYLSALVLVSSLAACSDGGTGEPGSLGSIDPGLIGNDDTGGTGGIDEGTGGPDDTNNGGDTTTPKGSKVLSVTWSAPSARANGDPLSLAEIASYQIYYGTKAGNYPNQVNVNDPTSESTQIEGLTSGTYYLVLTTLDTKGRESSYSPVIVVTM